MVANGDLAHGAQEDAKRDRQSFQEYPGNIYNINERYVQSTKFVETLMTLYFFHIDGPRHYVDTDGIDLADLEKARREALRIIGELMIDNSLGDVWSGGEWVMTVTHETGQALFSIRISVSQRSATRLN